MLERRFRTASAVLSAGVVAIGLVVMVGWILDLALFKRVFPAFETMTASTAVLFVVLGIGLWLARSRAPRAICAKRSLGLIVALGAAVALAEHVLELELRFDELLLRDRLSVASPGRMAPATGATFLLLALALVLQDRPLPPRMSQVDALIAEISALIGLFGSLYGAPSLHAVGIYASPALPAAVAFLLAASAFLLARPTEDITHLLTSDSAAGRLLRRLLPAILLVPVILGWVHLRGQAAGYYDARFGVALMTAATVIALTCFSSIIATFLHRSELRGLEIETARQRLLEDMRVAQARLAADVEAMTRLNQRLRDSEQRFRAGREQQLREMVENAFHAVAMLDKDMRYVEASPRWLRDYALGLDLIGKNHYEVFPEIPEHWKAVHRRCLAGATEQHDGEPFLRQGGSVQWVRWKIRPWHDLEGALAGILIYSEEITERKRAEEQRERLLAEIRDLTTNLEARVEERDEQARIHAERAVLLKEIHHRVKNNLQVVSSLFYLQARRTDQESVRRLLDESRVRLQSIALIHEKLYRSEQLASIDFGDYLRDLTATLTSAIGVQAPHVEVRVEAQDIFLDIDRAIPCALLVNELVSNSMKHAFPGGRAGKIRIAVTRTDSRLEVEVSDTGIGFPADLDFQHVKTLGLQLVMSLTKQLRGTVELVRGEGTTFRIHVPAQRPPYRTGSPPALASADSR